MNILSTDALLNQAQQLSRPKLIAFTVNLLLWMTDGDRDTVNAQVLARLDNQLDSKIEAARTVA